jgi:hypothetical protein
MSWLSVETAEGQTAFRPGDKVRGAASWSLDDEPESIELRLYWHTEGAGDQDLNVVEIVPFRAVAKEDQRNFVVRLPNGPYSFSGKLISLIWGLEVVAQPGELAGRTEIVVSPSGREILL